MATGKKTMWIDPGVLADFEDDLQSIIIEMQEQHDYDPDQARAAILEVAGDHLLYVVDPSIREELDGIDAAEDVPVETETGEGEGESEDELAAHLAERYGIVETTGVCGPANAGRTCAVRQRRRLAG